MIAALLDTDTLSRLHRGYPEVSLNAARYIREFGRLTLSEFSYYEVTRGLKAAGAITQLARFEKFCQEHQILPFSHAAAARAADI